MYVMAFTRYLHNMTAPLFDGTGRTQDDATRHYHMFKINSRRERERKRERDGLIVSTRACLEPTIQIAFCPFTN